jgi:hypothetical protein
MRAVFWKVLSLLLFPLRVVGYATDVHTLWTNRDVVLAVSMSLLSAALNAAIAFNHEYPWYIVLVGVSKGKALG